MRTCGGNSCPLYLGQRSGKHLVSNIPKPDKEDNKMGLKNLFSWNHAADTAASSACGSACGAGGKPEEKPAACGAGDKPAEQPTACGSACGAGDKR